MVLTEKGFQRPGFEELLSAQIERVKKLFGEDMDTSEQSVLGKYIRINVYDLADCYELLEEIYYARFPNSARGQSLDRLCAFAGIVRNPATSARIKVKFTGEPGTKIPAGFLISGKEQTFYVDSHYEVGSDGSCEAFMNCTVGSQAGNLPLTAELSIVNPKNGLNSAVILETIAYGKERESDTALRIRFNESVAGAGSATIDAIRGAISRVPLVDGVSIVENDTELVQDGLPPHSFECYVLAPESQDKLVAEAIFSKKPLGIRSIGDVETMVLDKGDKPHTIRFSRTLKKEIGVRIIIETNQFFESDGISQIRDNILDYVNNLANAEAVYCSSLYGHIHRVNGVVNVRLLELSADGESFSPDNIRAGEFEVVRAAADAIEIEVVT